MSDERLVTLVGGCCDGTLAPEERAELASLLAGDAPAQETAAAALFIDRLLAHALAPHKADLTVTRTARPRAPASKLMSPFVRITAMAASFMTVALTLWTVLRQEPPKIEPKAPSTLDLKVGDALDYVRSTMVALDLDAEIDGKKVKGTHTLTMEIGYRLDVKAVDKGLTFTMTIRTAKLGQKMTGFEEKDERWELPPDKSVVATLECDAHGRVERLVGELRAAFQNAGCSPRLAKIPAVYFFGVKANGKERDGAYAEGAILPDAPAASWSWSLQRVYGPGGLLDDFSSFEERWDAKAKSVEDGRAKGELTLADVRLARSFQTELKVDAKSGGGTVEFDAKTGALQAASFKHSFGFSGTIGKNAAKGTITRTETVKNAPAPVAKPEIVANEREASAALTAISVAQADFRSNDRDGNLINDFWVKDVSGLYRINPIGSEGAIKLIEEWVALADASPCVALDKEDTFNADPKGESVKLSALGKGRAKAGYFFVAMETYADEPHMPVPEKFDGGSGRNRTGFGFCAYPAEYAKTGKMTFIINADNTVWKKDTGGKPVKAFPLTPTSEGWSKVD